VLNRGEIVPFDCQTRGVESQFVLNQIFDVSPEPLDDRFTRMLKEYADLAYEGKAETPEGRKVYESLSDHFGASYLPLRQIEIRRAFNARRKENNA